MENRLMEFKSNILTWYPFKENSSILNLEVEFNDVINNLNTTFIKQVSCSNIYSSQDNRFICNIVKENKVIDNYDINNEKFDYITILGEHDYNFKNKLEFAKSHLNPNGIILLALDNKLGLNNWNKTSDLNKNISQKELIDLFKALEIKNSKFYYVFPNYRAANFIYSDEYEITNEDISRNFNVYDKDDIVSLNENKVYLKLLDEDKKLVNKFANSFFIELSQNDIANNIKYVSFTNYRKPEYRTMTIIDNDKVIKSASNKLAQQHILNMSKNLNELSNYDKTNVIEKYDNNKLISKFIPNKRFDEELSSCESIEEFVDKVNVLFNILSKDSFSYEEGLKQNIEFRECIKEYDIDKLNKLRFVKKGFIDYIPKNCFLINGEFQVFDQEWVEENIPVEYVYYRIILNTNSIVERFGKENLLKQICLIDYLDLFQQLELQLEEKVSDKELLHIFFRQYTEISKIKKDFNVFRENSLKYYNEVERIEEEKENLNIQLETAKTNLVEYANQLRIISNSSSWKLIQKIKNIIRFFNIFDGRSLFDRLHPIGSKSRIKIDEERRIKEENRWKELFINTIKNATDEETYQYWQELDKRIETRKHKLEQKEITMESDPYEFWTKANDPTIEELEYQRREFENLFEIKPKISIIIPLYNTPIKFFRELLHSLVYQTYSNWELCLADGSNEKLEYIEQMCKDSRIKYHYIGENKGISGNTNEALKLATGDYIALLDHDDLLPFNALFEIVKAINKNPSAEFIYTDEDKFVSIDEQRYDPHFKPDYSPDFLLAENYICHFSVFKKDIMDKINGFRSNFDGAQDYDIIIRAIEKIENKNNIIHIPKILYHWRIHPGSTAGNAEVKLYAFESGLNVLKEHLKRMNYNAEIKENEKYHGIYNAFFKLNNNPKISIVIINKNDLFNLKTCVNSILDKTVYKNYEIVIIDNRSDNNELLSYYNEITSINNIKILQYKETDEENIFKIKNWAINQIKTDYIVELDIYEIIQTPEWLDIMGGLAQRPDIGLVSPKIYYNDGKIKSTGLVYTNNMFSMNLYRGYRGGFRSRDIVSFNYSALPSICRMYKKNIFDQVGGYSEEFCNLQVNDMDYSFKIRELGLYNVYTPNVNCIDIDPVDMRNTIEDSKIFEYKDEIKMLKQKWSKYYNNSDPFHNINFNPQSNNCVIRIDKV